ncbi:hypothetical protein SEA_XENIA2_40 [Gordonia phage Xenia2]
MKFTRLTGKDGRTHYCDYELEPAYHCGRVAWYEATIPTTNPDFEWSEARCELHSVEAFHSGQNRSIDVDEDGQKVMIETFIAYGWRRSQNSMDSSYLKWSANDSRIGQWETITDAVDRDNAVELLGSIENLMGY